MLQKSNIFLNIIKGLLLFYSVSLCANTYQEKYDVMGGGFGGNEKIGQFIYSEKNGTYVSLPIQRDNNGICYLKNKYFKVVSIKSYGEYDGIDKLEDVTFACQYQDPNYGVYWDGDLLRSNGGYSPANDALYAAMMTNTMFEQWYGIPVIAKDDKKTPAQALLIVNDAHDPDRAGGWIREGQQAVTFGKGEKLFPNTTIDIVAHELGHNFTFQYSDLYYGGPSGGLFEAFGDMQAAAVEFFVTRKNKWVFGADVFRDSNLCNAHDPICFVRYMNNPTQDGESIDHIKNYDAEKSEYGNQHINAGIFDKAFYVLATSNGWDTKMAFDIMVQANRFYWEGKASFKKIACGMLKATRDYQKNNAAYTSSAVINALKSVGYVDSGDQSDYDIKDCE
jgi:pseudolysin